MILGVTREFFYCQIINSVISCLEAVLLFKCLFKSKKNKWISWVISFLFFAPKLIELVLKAQIENGNAQFYGLYLLFSFVIMLWPFVLATADYENAAIFGYFIYTEQCFTYIIQNCRKCFVCFNS